LQRATDFGEEFLDQLNDEELLKEDCSMELQCSVYGVKWCYT
jgi:hypothetical protein